MRFTNLASIQAQRRSRPPARFSRVGLSSTPCILSQTGTYMSQEECLAQTSCGWKYKCVDGACVQAPDGTYDTQVACFDKCFKYGCDGSGSCVRQFGGQYATLEECKCYDCINNECGPVPSNAQGAYAALADCQYDPAKQCGWKFACAADGDPSTFCKLVPGPNSTFASSADCRCVSAMGSPGPDCSCGYDPAVTNAKYGTLTQCQADGTDMCGWKYTCPPRVNLTIEPGGKSATFPGSNCSPKYVYYPIGPSFIAYSQAAEVTVSTPRTQITGTADTGSIEVRLIVAPFGNYEAGKLDPTSQFRNGTVNKAGCPNIPYDYTVNVGGSFVAATSVATLGGGATGNTDINTFTKTRVALQEGWQYQVLAQIFVYTDNTVKVTWTGGSIDLV